MNAYYECVCHVLYDSIEKTYRPTDGTILVVVGQSDLFAVVDQCRAGQRHLDQMDSVDVALADPRQKPRPILVTRLNANSIWANKLVT